MLFRIFSEREFYMYMGAVAKTARLLLPYSLALYSVAILTSMAGMEIFGWLTGTLTLIVWFFSDKKKNPLVRSIMPWLDLILGCFFLVVVIGAMLSPSPTADFIKIVGSVRWIFLYVLIRHALQLTWNSSAERLFQPLVLLCGIIGIYAIVQHYTGIDLLRSTGRAVQVFGPGEDGNLFYRSAGLFSSPLTYGNSVGIFLCFPLAAFLLGEDQKLSKRILMGVVSIILFLAVLSTMSRGVWLGVAAAILAMAWLVGGRLRVGMVGSILAAFVMAMLTSKDISHRLGTILNPAYKSNSDRVEIWQMNWRMFLDNPIVGVGYGENETLIRDYYQQAGIENGMVGHAHNTLLQVLSGTGIVGFLLFVAFLFSFLAMTYWMWRVVPRDHRWRRTLIFGSFGAQIFLLVAGMTECNFKDAEVNHGFMFILAVTSVLYLQTKGAASAAQQGAAA